MVIYLQFRRVQIYRIIIVIFLIILVILSGYFISYFRYNDRNAVDLEALRIQNKILLEKNEELKKYENVSEDYIIGNVIQRNMYDFYNEVVINLGEEDGIKKGDAVLNEEGLIGIVGQVDKTKSLVKLLSSEYNVSVKVNDIYGNLNNGRITLLDKYSEINKDDKVYTAGYSGLPSGIFIGTIEEVFMDKDNLGKEVSVNLIDNTNLNYISVFRGIQ